MSGTGEDGFTLLEMLVILAVVGLVASIGFPMLQSSYGKLEFDRAVTETGYAVRAARALAISRGQKVQLVQLNDGRLSAAGNVFVGPAPKSVTVILPSAGVSFFPDGEALPAEVAVRSSRAERRLVISADGRVE